MDVEKAFLYDKKIKIKEGLFVFSDYYIYFSYWRGKCRCKSFLVSHTVAKISSSSRRVDEEMHKLLLHWTETRMFFSMSSYGSLNL